MGHELRSLRSVCNVYIPSQHVGIRLVWIECPIDCVLWFNDAAMNLCTEKVMIHSYMSC